MQTSPGNFQEIQSFAVALSQNEGAAVPASTFGPLRLTFFDSQTKLLFHTFIIDSLYWIINSKQYDICSGDPEA